MNLILLEPDEASGAEITLAGRRAAHALEVLRVAPGDTVRVGIVGGGIGRARVVAAAPGRVVLETPPFDQPSPRPWFDIVLAMPRPKVMHRMWAPLASLGARRIFVVNAAKVERFYFDSHWLEPGTWLPLLREGMEQSCTTSLPQVEVRRRFRPFVEDEVPGLFAGAPKLLAHPYAGAELPGRFPSEPAADAALPVIAIGPEGGWTPFELDLLVAAGFRPFSIGSRPLRTDIATFAILGAVSGG